MRIAELMKTMWGLSSVNASHGPTSLTILGYNQNLMLSLDPPKTGGRCINYFVDFTEQDLPCIQKGQRGRFGMSFAGMGSQILKGGWRSTSLNTQERFSKG
jgi:hypothetical protein